MRGARKLGLATVLSCVLVWLSGCEAVLGLGNETDLPAPGQGDDSGSGGSSGSSGGSSSGSTGTTEDSGEGKHDSGSTESDGGLGVPDAVAVFDTGAAESDSGIPPEAAVLDTGTAEGDGATTPMPTITCLDPPASGFGSEACQSCATTQCFSQGAAIVSSCPSTVTCLESCDCTDQTCLDACETSGSSSCQQYVQDWVTCAVLTTCKSSCG
jgi:hypothetical protein